MSARRLGLVAVLSTAAAAASFGIVSPAVGAPALTPIPCAKTTDPGDAYANRGSTCARLDVPLDRSGAVPGTIGLYVKRRSAGTASNVAVVALAEGPGRSTTDISGFLEEGIAPAAESAPLVVFDQRGTGRSGPLSCPALDRADTDEAYAAAAAACAQSLGPGASHYTTRDTVADLEDLRVALGVGKLVLYGVSYGTKVALAYAAAHPLNVNSMVLDTVVDPAGTDVFGRGTYRAMRRVLTRLCTRDVCRNITTAPVRDIAALVRQLRRRPIRGSAFTRYGQRLTGDLTVDLLYAVVLAGDYDYRLRDELPSAVVAARRGDAGPLLSLAIRGGYDPSLPVTPAPFVNAFPEQRFNSAAYLATSCEELALPWDRATPVGGARRAAAAAAVRAIAPAAFAPFDRTQALDAPLLSGCSEWPNAVEAPTLATAPLAAIPTLVLAGATDLRTPVGSMRPVVARRLPTATFLISPDSGHGTIDGYHNECPKRAVTTFFQYRGDPNEDPVVRPCGAAPVRRVAPIPPVSLAQVPAAAGLPVKVGRTLNAVSATLSNALRQGLADRFRGGGPRGGRFVVTDQLRLSNYAYVPGVRVTGALPRRAVGPGRFTISGSAAAPGRVTVAGDGTISGTLGGRRVRGRIVSPLPSRWGRYAALG